MLSGTPLKMSHPSHFINHCIVAIILVVCIIPCVDTSMCVSIISPVFFVARLFVLSASSTLGIADLKQEEF